MAVYTCNYQTDSGRIQVRRDAPVYRLNDDVRLETTVEQDDPYLPQIFKDVILEGANCGFPFIGTRTVRSALVKTTGGDTLVICCPFRGGSISFEEFFDDLRSNPLITNVELIGEHINASLTRFNVGLGFQEY